MSIERKYEIRQTILESLSRIYPGGRTFDKLLADPDLAAIAVLREELLAEIGVLQGGGFLVDLKPRRGSYYKATYQGIMQIRQEIALDETVWGEGAL